MTVLGMVAEMERKFIRERQQAGIEAAKAKGVYKGRKPSVLVTKVRRCMTLGMDQPPSPRLHRARIGARTSPVLDQPVNGVLRAYPT